MTTLVEAAELVWRFREQWQAVWKTPSAQESLRYAYHEMGEAVSDLLRETRDDFRNRDRQPQVAVELADVAIMLITALGPEYEYTEDVALPEGWADLEQWAAFDRLCGELGLLLSMDFTTPAVYQPPVRQLLAVVDHLLNQRGRTLAVQVESKMKLIKERIRARTSWKYAYLQSGAKLCLFCKQPAVAVEAFEAHGVEVIGVATCQKCGKAWKLVYSLADAEVGSATT